MRESRSYYDVAGISCEDVIDGMNLLHREGAALKYLFRCNNVSPKGEVKEDMKKCRHYLYRCLKYSPIPRDYSASWYLDQINPDVFEDRIYEAIKLIIQAVGEPGASYIQSIEGAIYAVDNVIDKY